MCSIDYVSLKMYKWMLILMYNNNQNVISSSIDKSYTYVLAARNLISSLFHLPVEEGRRGKSVRLDMPGFT